MILQALCDYYERAGLAPLGWEFKEIPFLIVIDRNGKFISLEDMRESGAKKARAKSILVPKAEIRSGKNAWERPNLLWDHYGFVLATPKEETDDAQTMALKQNGVFINRIRQIYSDIGESPELTALLNFWLFTGFLRKKGGTSVMPCACLDRGTMGCPRCSTGIS